MDYTPTPIDPVLLKQIRDMARTGHPPHEIVAFIREKSGGFAVAGVMRHLGYAFGLSVRQLVTGWYDDDESMDLHLGPLIGDSRSSWEAYDA